MQINLCNESNIFSTYVFESATKLIDSKIWNISKLDFLTWRKNFKTSEEIYLSACLIDSLIYRTNDHIIASLKALFCQHLPSLIRFNKLLCTDNPIEKLTKKQNTIKIVTANTDDEFGKSSHIIANLLIKQFGINSSNIISPEKVIDYYENGTMLFIFTDDFLGTGDQFIQNIKYNFGSNISEKIFAYCPLIAHEKGIDAVKSAYPEIVLSPVELIRKDYSFFGKYFSDKRNVADDAKGFYIEFLKTKGFTDNFLGHGDLGLSVAFDYTIPDNSLLAFWGVLSSDSANKYNRLFKR